MRLEQALCTGGMRFAVPSELMNSGSENPGMASKGTLENFSAGKSASACPAWRRYCDRLHENLIVEWCGGWAFQQVLKTDVFHDAVGEGKGLERMPTESFLPKMKSRSNNRRPDMLICQKSRGRTGRLEKRERGGSAGLPDFPIQQKHIFRWNLRVIIPEDENRGRFDCRI